MSPTVQRLQFEIWILRLSLWNCFMKFTSTKENIPLLCQKEKRRNQNGGKRTAESAKPQTTRGCKGYDIAHKVITVSNWVSVNQRYFVSYPGLLIVSGGWKPFCRQQTQLSVKWIPPCWQALNKQLHTLCFILVQCSWHTRYKLSKLCCRDKIINFLLNFCTAHHHSLRLPPKH